MLVQQTILTILSQLEETKKIRILFACEAGSRAWGFPSTNSDYDVRFIYAHSKDWYLSLAERKDTIELSADNSLDITGWDLRKTLQLMKKSNVAPFEWLQSPTIYQAIPEFNWEFGEVAKTCFSPAAANYHYLSMAKKFYEICDGENTTKLKYWFHGLRAALNCRWIEKKQYAPPTDFRKTLPLLNNALRKDIEALIALKAIQNDDFVFEKEPSLLVLMRECIEIGENQKNSLPSNKVNMNAIDQFFINSLKSSSMKLSSQY